MALSTVSSIKTALGISGSTEDAALTLWLGQVSQAIRAFRQQYLIGVIASNTVANPTVVTCPGHGLETGDIIVVAGSNCTPTIDGERTITRVSEDTFTVPVTVTVAGTAGTFARKVTEYYGGNGRRELFLRQRPVQSVSSVYEDSAAYYGEADGAFPATSLLTAGTDYCLKRDNGTGAVVSKSGILLRIGSAWPGASERESGMLASREIEGAGNIKVTYTAGFVVLPSQYALAVAQMVAEVRLVASSGGGMQSESLEDYSYSRATAEQLAAALTSVQSLLGGKALVF